MWGCVIWLTIIHTFTHEKNTHNKQLIKGILARIFFYPYQDQRKLLIYNKFVTRFLIVIVPFVTSPSPPSVGGKTSKKAMVKLRLYCECNMVCYPIVIMLCFWRKSSIIISWKVNLYRCKLLFQNYHEIRTFLVNKRYTFFIQKDNRTF